MLMKHGCHKDLSVVFTRADLGLPKAECAIFASCHIALLHVTLGRQADHVGDHAAVLHMTTGIVYAFR